MILSPATLRVQTDETGREYHEWEIPQRGKVPGITGILRSAGYLAGIPPAEEAMALGTRIHRAIELWNLGDLDETSVCPDEQWGWQRWAEWVERSGFRLSTLDGRPAAEVACGNPALGYATAIDAIGEHPKHGLCVVNAKTGQEWPHYPVQMAGEAMCLRQSAVRLAIYLERDEPEVVYDSEDDYTAFRAACSIYWDKRRRGMR